MARPRKNAVSEPATNPEGAKASATITWLGDDGEPDQNTWNGVTFRKGEAVHTSDAYMIAKARNNRFYRVEDAGRAEPSEPDEPAEDRDE